MVRRILLLLCWLSFACPLQAADEYSLKATFIYRFAQFTVWPPPPRDQTRFCLLGQPALLQAFTALKLPLDVKELTGTHLLNQCDVLMLGISDRQLLAQWQAALAGTPLLIVTDNNEAYRQLGVIQLITSPDGISFQVNLQRAAAHQLKLGSQLLKLASQVD
jgi:hypothetical protein